MADGCSQGVCAVVWPRVVIKGEDVSHHEDDLAFVSRPCTHHRLLDLHRRVLPQLETGLCRRNKCCATSVRRCKRRAGVLSKEDFLDGKLAGRVRFYSLGDALVDLSQAPIDGLR